MVFDPNTFPVRENDHNKKIYAEGKIVHIPPGTTCQLSEGRVTKVNYGKPGGLMLISVEAVS